jgi:hypothetical protein
MAIKYKHLVRTVPCTITGLADKLKARQTPFQSQYFQRACSSVLTPYPLGERRMPKKSASSSAAEEPSIELYMYSLNQEFPKEKGHAHFLKRYSAAKEDLSKQLIQHEQVESQVFNLKSRLPQDWSVQWLSNQWIENHTKAIGLGLREEIDPMERAMLRQEDFGGILFEPLSDRVFRLNQAGYNLFTRLREFYSKNKNLREFTSKEFNSEATNRFIAYLEGAGLWKRG